MDDSACKRILFLCTGNYYRSRFAEILFNALAAPLELRWQAASRGLALERGVHNVGPMSMAACAALARLGIHTAAAERFPLGVCNEDFEAAALVIALDRDEHLPLLRERFPLWQERTEYWEVKDLPADVATALASIEEQVRSLVTRLRDG